MKGYISITIPTKAYIKAFIISKLGDPTIITNETVIGNKFYDLLQHSTNNERCNFPTVKFNAVLKICISVKTYQKRGSNINHTNIMSFNSFIEGLIKDTFNERMAEYIEVLPSFEANLPAARKLLGIDIESWSDDSMKKEHYRYRKKKNLPPLYKKNFAEVVPSDSFANLSW